MGRPPKLTPQQQKEARRRRAEGAPLKEPLSIQSISCWIMHNPIAPVSTSRPVGKPSLSDTAVV
jgi:hypothetical protein